MKNSRKQNEDKTKRPQTHFAGRKRVVRAEEPGSAGTVSGRWSDLRGWETVNIRLNNASFGCC